MLILSHSHTTSSASHLRPDYPIAVPETRLPLKNYQAVRKTRTAGSSSSYSSIMPSTSDLSLHRNSGISTGDALSGSMTSNSNPNSRPHSPTKNFDFPSGSRPHSPIKNFDFPTRPITPPTPPDSPVINDQKFLHSPVPITKKSPPSCCAESLQDEYLQFIEPGPVCPPKYETLPPGGCPKFPVLAPLSFPLDETLPSYTPSIYKIGIVSRKIEWLTPYEASPSRSWKHLIMELNSTQLNFYTIPTTLENHLLSFKPTALSNERNFNNEEELEIRNFKSFLTSDDDLQFLKYCQRLGLLNSSANIDGSGSSANGVDSELYNAISNNNNFIPLTSRDQKLLKSSKHKKLIRSYSLQYTRLGLATDYKKRANVLRLRIESEQILLNFSTTRDLIEWNTAINIGKDVSLDINEREFPRYRTVPRRRRSNRTYPADDSVFYQNSLGHSTSNLSVNSNSNGKKLKKSRKRAQSDSKVTFDSLNSNSSFKNKLSKLKTKLSSSASSRSNSVSSSNLKFMSEASLTKHNKSKSSTQVSFTPSLQTRQRAATVNALSTNSSNEPVPASLDPIRSNSVPSFSIAGYEEDEEFEGDDDDDRHEYVDNTNPCTHSSSPGGQDEEDEEDIQNLSDLHRSDDEDDEDEDEDDEVEYGDDEDDIALFYADIEVADNEEGLNQSRRNTHIPTSSFASSGDFKWLPTPEKPQSQRKFYRNCLRCIKPLTSEDSWVTRALVRPTTISPLNLSYLRNMKYDPSRASSISNANSVTSLVSLVSTSSIFNNNGGTASPMGSRKKSFSSKDNSIGLLDSSLSRIPNHYLKEFTVGTHGLIPKII